MSPTVLHVPVAMSKTSIAATRLFYQSLNMKRNGEFHRMENMNAKTSFFTYSSNKVRPPIIQTLLSTTALE
jgi:hypothetical protein